MVKRRELLETGKEAGQSVAGTIGSIAGTIGSGIQRAGEGTKSVAGTLTTKAKAKTRNVAEATKEGVRNQYEELTDETVTDQEQARLQRARQEALQEARKEARQEFQEEFRENVFDEAYDSELQRLRRKQGVRPEQNQTETDGGTQTAASAPRQPIGMGLFGVPTGPPQQQTQPRSEPRGTPPIQQQMSIFGVPAQQPRQESQDQGVRRDPLFGLEY